MPVAPVLSAQRIAEVVGAADRSAPDRTNDQRRKPEPMLAAIRRPVVSVQLDYEGEMVAIIGKGGRHIAADNWKDHVFGYLNLNDVSARDFQLATTQWVIGKTFDTFCPMGPYLVTADEIADPHDLDISLTLNGEVLQSSNTKNLIFAIPELIRHLSSVFTLEPGDIISTGTPAFFSAI